MRIVKGLYFFYQKLIIPALVISLALSYFMMAGNKFYMGAGISFLLLSPLFHYLTYEVRSPHEYYFYYNLGLSKLVLWINTLMISLIIGLTLIML